MNRLIRFLALGIVGLSLIAPALTGAQSVRLPLAGEQTVATPSKGDQPKVALTPRQPTPKVAPPLAAVKPPPPRRPDVFKPPRPPREPIVKPPPPPRKPAELHPEWPLKRPPHDTVVRRRRLVDRIPPVIFLPPVVFGGIVIDDRRDRYLRDRLAWSDGETLYREDDWVEIVLDCNARGEKLWLEVSDGRVRIDWAEIVFEDGETQVVDFSERTIGPGLYVLHDFHDGRRADHVRMVAQAATREVRLILRIER